MVGASGSRVRMRARTTHVHAKPGKIQSASGHSIHENSTTPQLHQTTTTSFTPSLRYVLNMQSRPSCSQGAAIMIMTPLRLLHPS